MGYPPQTDQPWNRTPGEGVGRLVPRLSHPLQACSVDWLALTFTTRTPTECDPGACGSLSGPCPSPQGASSPAALSRGSHAALIPWGLPVAQGEATGR